MPVRAKAAAAAQRADPGSLPTRRILAGIERNERRAAKLKGKSAAQLDAWLLTDEGGRWFAEQMQEAQEWLMELAELGQRLHEISGGGRNELV